MASTVLIEVEAPLKRACSTTFELCELDIETYHLRAHINE